MGSVVGTTRCSNNVQVNQKLYVTSNTYMQYNGGSSKIEFYVDGARAVSMGSSSGSGWSGSGTLHGSWESDETLSVASSKSSKDADPAAWLLRELRPVSYKLKTSSESKEDGKLQFGFLADEIERVLPHVVRKPPSSDPHGYWRVAYQDLIALLTLIVQRQQERLDVLEQSVALLMAERQPAFSKAPS